MKKIFLLGFLVILVFLIYYINIDNTINYLSLGDYLSYGVNSENKLENSYSNKVYKYLLKNNKKVKYINYSFKNDYRIIDLKNDILNNSKISFDNKKYTLKQLLIKADIITLSIGMNDMYYQKNIFNKYKYTDEMLYDLDILLSLIRKNCKEKIYILNYYNVIENQKVVNYSNRKLLSIANKYKIKIIDISGLDKYLKDNIYPENKGYDYIFNQIKKIYKN